MSKNKRIDKDVLDNLWTSTWDDADTTNLIEGIRKYENLRWILKYAPVHGKFLEAGCGVGQYVFYFSRLGFDIDGIDISNTAIDKCNNFSNLIGYDYLNFSVSDVRELPYGNDSISYYLSFGVIEHMPEGPMQSLNEAFRILKPGGVIFVGTPQRYSLKIFLNWLVRLPRLPKRFFRNILFKLGFKKDPHADWVEYRWSICELKKFVEDAGFLVVDIANVGIKRSIEIVFRSSHPNRTKLLNTFKNRLFPFLDKYEDSFFSKFGINNIIIGIKPSSRMHCFFCSSKRNFRELNLNRYSVPACKDCKSTVSGEILNNYIRGKRPFFSKRIYGSKTSFPDINNCDFCKTDFNTDILFKDYSFSRSVCDKCLNQIDNLLKLRNLYVKYED